MIGIYYDSTTSPSQSRKSATNRISAHVHVFKGNGQAKINLGNPNEPPALVQIWQMSDRDAVKALEIVKLHQTELRQRWEQIHG